MGAGSGRDRRSQRLCDTSRPTAPILRLFHPASRQKGKAGIRICDMGKGAGPHSRAASLSVPPPAAPTPFQSTPAHQPPHYLAAWPACLLACLQTSVFAEPSVRFGGVLGSWLGTEQLVLSARDNSKVGPAGGGAGSPLAGLPA